MTQSTETAPAAPLPSPKERRRLREARSLSQEQVAALLGVTRRTIKAWESGRSDPKHRKRAAYAKLLASFSDEPDEPAQPTGTTGTAEPTQPAEPTGTAEPTEPVTATATATATAEQSTVPGGDVPERSPQGVERNTPEEIPVPECSTPEETPPRGTDPSAPQETPTTPPSNHQTAETSKTDQTAQTTHINLTPAQAFGALYEHSAPALLRQAYLLTGSRRLSRESVEYAFRLAWQRWPEVARDRDPAGWVRAATYEYAVSPWHKLRRAHTHPDRPPTDRDRRVLLQALLDLPPMYRRTLLLYDGVGLDLPDTAAETEASTPATAGRLLCARAVIAHRLPELAQTGTPAEQTALLQERLRKLAEIATAPAIRLPPARAVRKGSERRTRFWTRAALFFTAVIVGATGFTVATAPTRYDPPPAPGKPVGGVPVRGGPQTLTPEDEELRSNLHGEPMIGPPRLVPETR